MSHRATIYSLRSFIAPHRRCSIPAKVKPCDGLQDRASGTRGISDGSLERRSPRFPRSTPHWNLSYFEPRLDRSDLHHHIPSPAVMAHLDRIQCFAPNQAQGSKRGETDTPAALNQLT